MSWEAWFTLAVILVTIVVLASERVSAPIVVLGGVTTLLLFDVLDAKQAFTGFSSEAPVTIAALYVMAGAAESTGALDRITALAVGRKPAAPGQRSATVRELLRVLLPSTTMSTLVYNTPTVGMLAPQVRAWANRTGRAPSWYLLALNYAVLLGGLVTAIGTTTNVVVSGLLSDDGLPPLGLFEITKVGLPIAVAGLVLILFLGPRLMPTRESSRAGSAQDIRDFTLAMEVRESGPLVGSTVADAGLRSLEGVYLVEIERGGRLISPVAPDRILWSGDRLIFAGNVNRVLDLQRIVGLTSAEDPHLSVTGEAATRRFYEVVVANGSSLVCSSLRDADFRGRFNAAVLAVHRSGGERVPGKLGSVTLHAGDVLLVVASEGWDNRWRGNVDFLAIAGVSGARPLNREKAVTVGLVFLGFLVLSASGVLDVLKASLVAAFALVALRVITPAEARRSVDLNVVVTLAASFGLGEAMSESGLAVHLAGRLVDLLEGFGQAGVLTGVVVATVIVTQLVTNNAAAIVMFPIAQSAALQSGGSARTYILGMCCAASMSYLTPIGYQTNLMVQGLASYRFRDFIPLGLPLVVLTTAVTIAVLTPLT